MAPGGRHRAPGDTRGVELIVVPLGGALIACCVVVSLVRNEEMSWYWTMSGIHRTETLQIRLGESGEQTSTEVAQ